MPKFYHDPPDWKDKYSYREAKGSKSCATCSAFRGGKCEMFDAPAEADMTCDEWSNTWKKTAGDIYDYGNAWVGNLSFLVSPRGDGQVLMGQPDEHHTDVWSRVTGEELDGMGNVIKTDSEYFQWYQGNIGVAIDKDSHQITLEEQDANGNEEVLQEAEAVVQQWLGDGRPMRYTGKIDEIPDTWFNKESNDDQAWQEDGGAGAEAQEAAGAPAGQVEFNWPSAEEAQELSYHAVDNHQGFRDPGGFASAVGNARYQQIYGGVNDVYTLAAHLINYVQRQQALVEGNKRTGTLLGLWFLEENGVSTDSLPPEEFGDLVVAMSEKAVTPEQVGEYLRKWLSVRTSMAVSPDVLQQHIDRHGPLLWHGTNTKNVPSILQHGILPHDQVPEGADAYPWSNTSRPMPGVTYMRHMPQPQDYYEKEDEPSSALFGIDLTKLDPKKIIMDEDNVPDRWNDETRKRLERGEGMGEITRDQMPEQIDDVDSWLPTQTENAHQYKDRNYNFTLAYDGTIPPEAIAGLYHQNQWYDPEDYLGDDYMRLYEPQDHELGFEAYAKFVLKSDWNDVMSKAKRLIQEGKVTILHNTPQHVMCQVMGDGSDNDGSPDMHEVEFSRDDPESNVITQSVCDCAYNQYRWDRTRPWKKFEGRPCSHILAAYWKSKSTPQDIEDAQPGYQVPVGQKGPAAPPGQMKIPGTEPGVTKQDLGFGAGAFTPEGQEGAGAAVPPPVPSTQQIGIPGQPQNPFNPPKTTPGAPSKNPTPQREQLNLFDLSPEPSTTPPNPAVSVPGATPPTPENPVQLPGTFSKVAGEIQRHGDELVGNLSFLFKDGEVLMGEPGYHHPDIWQEHTGEQVFDPELGDFPIPEDHPYWRMQQGSIGFAIQNGQITELYNQGFTTVGPQIEQAARDTINAWMRKTGITDASQVPEDWTTQFDLPGEQPKLAVRLSAADDEMLQHFIAQQGNGDPIYVATTKPQTLEYRGGKHPVPGAQPYDVSTEGVPLYKTLELGYNPETGQRENADVNELSGAPEWRGQYGDVPANRRGEVRDFDPHLGWAHIHVPLHYPGGEDARLHPHSLAGWVPMSELRVVHPPRTPFRRK